MGKLEITPSGLTLDGKEFYLASGDIHYFRIHAEDWGKRLDLAKDFGLTAIQTYVPWHLHEPKRGQFDFSGNLDLARFIKEADARGLKVLFRPSPYICSECDFGGLPAWLLQDPRMEIRCCNKNYLAAVRSYYERLVKEFLPLLSTNGGPIIAVAIENEYGGAGFDTEYLTRIKDMLTELGVDVPFFMTDGNNKTMMDAARIDGVWHGVNFRSTPAEVNSALNMMEKLRPEFPLFVGELWCGRALNWGVSYQPREPKETAEAYKIALERGAYVNFYMFCGGTNFGFTSGALIGTPYTGEPAKYYPYETSYDCDALISEDGQPTEKYFLCRDVLDAYLGKPKREHIPPVYETQSISPVKITHYAHLLENADRLCANHTESATPMCMEDLGQEFGYVLYSSTIPVDTTDALKINFEGVFDRATVYADDNYLGLYMRDAKNDTLILPPAKRGTKLQILVENIARTNNGSSFIRERKGLVGEVALRGMKLHHWKNISLPLDNLAKLDYKPMRPTAVQENAPVFLRGTFDAKPNVDTFVDTRELSHGNIWINGFNIGRFWDIGPQKTLYVPGALLKEKGNVIEILDVHPLAAIDCIRFNDKHLLI